MSSEAHKGTLVVVLGMHRSGTSAITRAMETMGADFGSRLIPAIAGVNDKGFFEDLDVNALDMEVMAAAGADWHTMAPIELDVIDPQRLDKLQTSAIALLRDKCTAKTFALKDPRIARLLPFWQPVFACLDVRVVYVIAIRNPISVAQSLAKRNSFPEEKSYLLWLAHVLPALTMTRDSVRVFVNYDSLMDAPDRELARISSQLNLPLNLQRVADFESAFLDNELRHTRYSSRDLGLIRSTPRQIKELFAALEIASCTSDARHTPALNTSIENAQRYLEDIAPLLRYEWRVDQQVQQLHKMLADSSDRTGELNNLLADRNRRIDELDKSLHEAEETRARFEQVSSENLSQLDNALHQVEETRARLEQLSRADLSQQEIIRSLEQTAAMQRAELCHSAEVTAQILDSMSWRVTAPLRAIRRSISPRKDHAGGAV